LLSTGRAQVVGACFWHGSAARLGNIFTTSSLLYDTIRLGNYTSCVCTVLGVAVPESLTAKLPFVVCLTSSGNRDLAPLVNLNLNISPVLGFETT
jgi:hypothetical protein